MSLKIVALALLIAVALSRDYPMFKQCDQKWGGEQLGTSGSTLCQAGCVVSSVAMALAGIGKQYDPGTLNSWLKDNGGYISGSLFVWGSVGKIGLSFQGKIAKEGIAASLNAGNVVILNVLNGAHWVLATTMVDDNTIAVNDPTYDTKAYRLQQVVANNSALYQVTPGYLGMMVDELQLIFNVDGKRNKMIEADAVNLHH